MSRAQGQNNILRFYDINRFQTAASQNLWSVKNFCMVHDVVFNRAEQDHRGAASGQGLCDAAAIILTFLKEKGAQFA